MCMDIREVEVRVTGFCAEDAGVEAVMAEHFPDVLACGDNPVTLRYAVPAVGAAAAAAAHFRAMQAHLPGLQALGVARDLVSVTDIARRVGITREGARRWCNTPTFPAPYSHLMSAGMEVWEWAAVVTWLAEHRSIHLPDLPLNAVEAAELEWLLLRPA